MREKNGSAEKDVLLDGTATQLLILVNVYQPVSFQTLKSALSYKLDEKTLEQYLEHLKAQGLIKYLKDNSYRATWKGINSLVAKRLRLARDIQRMSHLAVVAGSGLNTTGR